MRHHLPGLLLIYLHLLDVGVVADGGLGTRLVEHVLEPVSAHQVLMP